MSWEWTWCSRWEVRVWKLICSRETFRKKRDWWPTFNTLSRKNWKVEGFHLDSASQLERGWMRSWKVTKIKRNALTVISKTWMKLLRGSLHEKVTSWFVYQLFSYASLVKTKYFKRYFCFTLPIRPLLDVKSFSIFVYFEEVNAIVR